MSTVIRAAVFFFGLLSVAFADDVKYVEWDTGAGGIALKALDDLCDAEITNKLIDAAGLGDITKDVNFHMFPLSFKGHSITPSLDSVKFSGLDTIDNLKGINVNGHYNLTTGGSLQGLKWGATFSNVVKNNGVTTHTFPLALTGGVSGMSFNTDMEVLADASKLDLKAIVTHPTNLFKAVVDAQLNSIDLEIASLDNVYVQYVDDSEIGKMVTDRLVKMANDVLLPEITKAANAAATDVVNTLLSKLFKK